MQGNLDAIVFYTHVIDDLKQDNRQKNYFLKNFL